MKTQKTWLLLVLIIALVTSCTKETTPPVGVTTKTWKCVKLTEIAGKDTGVFNFDKDPAIQAKWVFDFVWGNGRGWDLDDENIGNGIRYTPIDPRVPNGERVVQKFKWYMLGWDIGNFGGNTAYIVVINDTHIVLHQTDGDIVRLYDLLAVVNGWNMDGKGFTRPG